MGTNYFRIPSEKEMIVRKNILIEKVNNLILTPSNIHNQFNTPKIDSWEYESLWVIFLKDTNVHLGKRSMGWKFCWNFHNNLYYSNKEELLDFIRSGRVVDEYGEEQDAEEFVEMALNWGEPDGHLVNEEYRKKIKSEGLGSFYTDPKYDDIVIDGLRVSSSIEFF